MKSEVKYDLNSLSFAITNQCNLKCSFCSRDAQSISNHMSKDVIEYIIEEALEFSDLKVVNLSGGEPLLHPDLDNILKTIFDRNLEIRINTNGMLFNQKNLDILTKYKVKKFTISLDSVSPEIHDKLRGKIGTFKKTIAGIKQIRDMGAMFYIKMTVNSQNVHEMYNVMKLAESLGAVGFSYSRTIPIGRAKDLKEDKTLEFFKNYSDMGIKCSRYIVHSNSKMNLVVDDPLRHLFDVRAIKKINSLKDNDYSRIWGGCTAGLSYLYILLDGSVLACTALLKPVGNINEQSLKEIWYNNEILQLLRSRKHLKGKCGQCDRKYLCGGCRAYAYAQTGDVSSEDVFCYY